MSDSQTHHVTPFRIALTHRCPKCEQGKLYQSIIKLRESCDACGLSFIDHDSGDGPAFFTICVLGFLVTGAAVAVELIIKPNYWVHGALWIPAMIIFTPFWLRFFKSYLLALQYKMHLLKPTEPDPN